MVVVMLIWNPTAAAAMSSAISSSVGNMPPRHGKKLAEVMDEAYKANNNRAEADDDKSELGELSEPPQGMSPPKEPAQPEIKQVQGYTVIVLHACYHWWLLTDHR